MQTIAMVLIISSVTGFVACFVLAVINAIRSKSMQTCYFALGGFLLLFILSITLYPTLTHQNMMMPPSQESPSGEYDTLQECFLSISADMSEQEFIDMIGTTGLFYSVKEYDTDYGKKCTLYRLSNTLPGANKNTPDGYYRVDCYFDTENDELTYCEFIYDRNTAGLLYVSGTPDNLTHVPDKEGYYLIKKNDGNDIYVTYDSAKSLLNALLAG